MHLNSILMIGRVSAKGPSLRYSESGVPSTSFVLEVDEIAQGKVYTTFIPCEISGKYAEATASDVEPGDVLQIAGKWKYKSVVDPKSGAKISKPVVSSWGVSQRLPAETPPYQSDGSGEIVEPEPAQTAKPRKPRYPRSLKQPWVKSQLSEN